MEDKKHWEKHELKGSQLTMEDCSTPRLSALYALPYSSGKGLEIETYKDTQTETWVILETGMPPE